MPEPVFSALVANLPEVESRRHASTAQLAWLVHSALSKSKTRVADWLPAFAQVDARASTVAGLPPGIQEDISVGAAGKWLRQELLDAVLAASEG